jgi:hypothetical protein
MSLGWEAELYRKLFEIVRGHPVRAFLNNLNGDLYDGCRSSPRVL